MLALLDEARVVDDEHAFRAKDAADTPPHVFLNQRVFPVALVDELLERLDVVLLRLIDRGEPISHRLDALAITVEQEPAEIRRAPVFPLTASDAGGDVLDERLHLVLQLVKLPCIHARKHEVKTDLAQDQLT